MKNLTLPALLLALAGLLTACPGTPTPDGGVSATVIKGTVSGATFPSGSAVLGNYDGSSGANEGTFTSPNQLNLTLQNPPENQLTSYLLSTGQCTFTGTSSVNPVVAIFTEVDIFTKNYDLMGYVVQHITSGGLSDNSVIARLYSSAAATVKGSENCGSFVLNYDLNLKAGWNAIEYFGTETSVTLRNPTSGVTTELLARTYDPQVLVALDNDLSFTTSSTVSVKASLYQIGGYSGPVKLSTDLFGLSVSPATITLSPLSAQQVKPQSRFVRALGLGAQRLDTTLNFTYSGRSVYSQTFKIIAKDSAGQQVGGGRAVITSTLPGISIPYVQPTTLEVLPGSQSTLNVALNGENGFSGDVTVGISDLPNGLSADTKTVTLNGSSYLTLTIKAGSTLTPGEYTANVTATGGGKSTTAPVQISIPKPSIILTIGPSGYAYKSIYQNSSDSLTVNVSSYAGFSGSTTLTLTNLPSGVTSTSKTITVKPGTTTTVEMPLIVASNAALGTSTIKVASPDLKTTNPTPTAELKVYPARVKLSQSTFIAGRAADGMWIMDSQISTASGTQVTLKRYTVSGLAKSVTVNVTGNSSPRYVNQADSSLLVLGTDDQKVSSAAQVKDDGSVTSLSASPIRYTDAVSPQVDLKGRVWLIQRATRDAGVLAHWSPSTGQITEVDATQDYVLYSNAGTFQVSQNGRYVLYAAFNGSWLIDASVDSVKKVPVSDMLTYAVPADDGTIWYSNGSQLKHLNADGTVTTFNEVNASKVVGFDRINTNILWMIRDSSFTRFDTTTSTEQAIAMPSFSSALPLSTGGVVYVWRDYNSSDQAAYATFLK